MKSNKFWIILLGGVVITSIITMFLLSRVPAGYAHIYQDGKLTETVNLSGVSEPYMFSAASGFGVNLIDVEPGRIRVLEASCPDGLCVRQGWVSSGFVPIVCLPNRLVITFEGGHSDNGVDAVVG